MKGRSGLPLLVSIGVHLGFILFLWWTQTFHDSLFSGWIFHKGKSEHFFSETTIQLSRLNEWEKSETHSLKIPPTKKAAFRENHTSSASASSASENNLGNLGNVDQTISDPNLLLRKLSSTLIGSPFKLSSEMKNILAEYSKQKSDVTPELASRKLGIELLIRFQIFQNKKNSQSSDTKPVLRLLSIALNPKALPHPLAPHTIDQFILEMTPQITERLKLLDDFSFEAPENQSSTLPSSSQNSFQKPLPKNLPNGFSESPIFELPIRL